MTNMIHNSEEIQMIDEVIEKKAMRYLDDVNVTAVGVALKEKKQSTLTQLAIRFNVKYKYSLGELKLKGRAIIPDYFIYKGKKILTDIVERNYKYSNNSGRPIKDLSRTKKLDVIRPGISVGYKNKKLRATMGPMIKLSGKDCFITCNHAIDGKKYDPVTQPCFSDLQIGSDSNEYVVGHIVEYSKKYDYTIVELDKSKREFDSGIFGIYRESNGSEIPPDRIEDPIVGLQVFKSGRTTGVTHGIVKCFNMRRRTNDTEPIGFEIKIDSENKPQDCELAMGGDSGAPWMYYGDNKKLVWCGMQISSDPKVNANCNSEFAFAHRVVPIKNKFILNK